MNSHRIIARDRRAAAAHEAGHAIVALQLGVAVLGAHIRRNQTDDILSEKTFLGQTTYSWPHDAAKVRLIAVAGMVAEEVWKARGRPYESWEETLSDPACMSTTDWACTGCEPGEPDDALIEAAETVEDMLGGELLPKLIALSRRLIEADSRQTADAMLNVMALLGHTVVRGAAPWRVARGNQDALSSLAA